MDKALDEVVKENRKEFKQKKKDTRSKKEKAVGSKKGAAGFKKSRKENKKPDRGQKRKQHITDRIKTSRPGGDHRDNPSKSENQIRVLNLDYNVTEDEVKVRHRTYNSANCASI